MIALSWQVRVLHLVNVIICLFLDNFMYGSKNNLLTKFQEAEPNALNAISSAMNVFNLTAMVTIAALLTYLAIWNIVSPRIMIAKELDEQGLKAISNQLFIAEICHMIFDVCFMLHWMAPASGAMFGWIYMCSLEYRVAIAKKPSSWFLLAEDFRLAWFVYVLSWCVTNLFNLGAFPAWSLFISGYAWMIWLTFVGANDFNALMIGMWIVLNMWFYHVNQ